MSGVASATKIGFHKAKVQTYLEGRAIFPATLELDITSRCTRTCRDCPSSRSKYQHDLPMGFIADLFDALEGQTKGLLLTGGEPTMSPLFPRVLRLARDKGFEDIAVVTNGSQLREREVIDALIGFASTIRISLYDWGPESCGGIIPTLDRIASLREEIDRQDSPLKIGVSALTSRNRASRLVELAEAVRSAGAHWIYYHPMCTGWGTGNLEQLDQTGIIEEINRLRETAANGFRVFASSARYTNSDLTFSRYHAAHFLLVIGADGKNYLGPEVKYQPSFIIADLAADWRGDFLLRPGRIEKINAIDSRTYSALSSRHRGVLYNDYLEKLKRGQKIPSDAEGQTTGKIWFPHIL